MSRTAAVRRRAWPARPASSPRRRRACGAGRACRPGDDREVVVGAAPVHAHRSTTSRRGSGRRARGRSPAAPSPASVGNTRSSNRRFGGAVVRGVVVEPVGMRLAVPGDDRDRLGRDALEAGELVRVDAHLEDRGGLDALGELGVRDVVAPRRRGPTAGRRAGRRKSGCPRQRPSKNVPWKMTSVPARIAASVSASASRSSAGVLGLAARHLARRCGPRSRRRSMYSAARARSRACRTSSSSGSSRNGFSSSPRARSLLERDQVVALEEADEVCGGHDQRAVVMELHRAATVARGRASSRVTGSRVRRSRAWTRRPDREPPLDCRRAAASEAPEPHRRARPCARSRRRGRASSTGRSARRWRTAGSTTCRTRASRCPSRTRRYAGEWALAFRMLRNAGVAPPWIEADKEVRELLARRDALVARAGGVVVVRARARSGGARAARRPDQRGRRPAQRRGADHAPAPRARCGSRSSWRASMTRLVPTGRPGHDRRPRARDRHGPRAPGSPTRLRSARSPATRGARPTTT